MNNFANIFKYGVLTLGVLAIARAGFSGQSSDAKLSAASEDYTLVETGKYSIEVPRGWAVGRETPWGARDITPTAGSGKIGAMTAGPTKASWDDLYKTSLYFIKREGAGTATPYRAGKTKMGYECIRFEVRNDQDFADRLYTLVKGTDGNVLALSIKIPSPDQAKSYLALFKHMEDTAKLRS